VILCEKDRARRAALRQSFPRAIHLDSHDKAADLLGADHRYALWVSDPCGYSGHGVEAMRRIARRPGLRSDFVIVLNQGALDRLIGTKGEMWEKHRNLYLPMAKAWWWGEQLQKRWVASSKLIKQSRGFQFRLIVVADFLGDAACRYCPETFDRPPVGRGERRG
jgi:hypothetical protein